MSTASAYMTVRGIDIDVIFKDIKNLHIAVYPPLGRVRVAAPSRLDKDAIRLAVIQRLPWIKMRRTELQQAERQSVREMVTGESHYFEGLRLRLKVIERPGRSHVEVDGDRLVMYVPAGKDTVFRTQLMHDWQRARLRDTVRPLIAHWEPIVGNSVPRWSIRRMKTKWGSCNRETGHIWFNLDLAKKHPRCVEYIVMHEMTHLLERNHGERFQLLMDQYLPDWRLRRDELNAAPLDAFVTSEAGRRAR